MTVLLVFHAILVHFHYVYIMQSQYINNPNNVSTYSDASRLSSLPSINIGHIYYELQTLKSLILQQQDQIRHLTLNMEKLMDAVMSKQSTTTTGTKSANRSPVKNDLHASMIKSSTHIKKNDTQEFVSPDVSRVDELSVHGGDGDDVVIGQQIADSRHDEDDHENVHVSVVKPPPHQDGRLDPKSLSSPSGRLPPKPVSPTKSIRKNNTSGMTSPSPSPRTAAKIASPSVSVAQYSMVAEGRSPAHKSLSNGRNQVRSGNNDITFDGDESVLKIVDDLDERSFMMHDPTVGDDIRSPHGIEHSRTSINASRRLQFDSTIDDVSISAMKSPVCRHHLYHHA